MTTLLEVKAAVVNTLAQLRVMEAPAKDRKAVLGDIAMVAMYLAEIVPPDATDPVLARRAEDGRIAVCLRHREVLNAREAAVLRDQLEALLRMPAAPINPPSRL